VNLKYTFTEVPEPALKEKIKVILLKTPSGTLFLEVAYLKAPDNIESISSVHIPATHGSLTPPSIEWQPASLSVSSSSPELSPPYSPLGQKVLFVNPSVLPRYLSEDKEEIIVTAKKERKSYDVSQLTQECNKILMNFDKVLKEVEGKEEVLKEFYAFKFDQHLG
jgi:hypothetical protein